MLWPILDDEWLRSLPEYESCVECLKSDVVVGPHLGRVVGSSMTAMAFDANSMLTSLLHGMLDDEGHLAFTRERFHRKWQEWADFFVSDRIIYKTIMPLPGLNVSEFPLKLNDELVLDRLTDDEVTRCYSVGVIRSPWPGLPLIGSEIPVGIRRATFLPKLMGDEPREPPKDGNEGFFGKRPIYRDDLVMDDVLSALRLFKRTQIRATGFARWTDSPLLRGGIIYVARGHLPFSGAFELSEVEVPHFLELWRLLEEGAECLRFSIHRFNLAFDRGLVGDRIVDLVISAEAPLLGDTGNKDRGELRFRFALRAAKFIKRTDFGERDVYRKMREAYDARSAVVHGGEASLPEIDVIEDLVRLGLRTALSMKEDRGKLRRADYWETLVLSEVTTS